MANIDFGSSPRQRILLLVVAIGISGIGLASFYFVFHRDDHLAKIFLWTGGLNLIGFAIAGHLFYRRQTYMLLAPPIVNACLWILAVSVVFIGVFVIWFEFVCLFYGAWVAFIVAGHFVTFLQIDLKTRHRALFLIFATVFLLFETSSIITFPYVLGQLLECLESFGFRIFWS